MAKVKCPICGLEFDKDRVKCVRHGARRYAHFDCYPEGQLYESSLSQEEIDKKNLSDYIIKLYGLKACGPNINKEIKRFHDEYGYTYSGIMGSLVWWYEVKGNKVEDKWKGTIAIVGSIYTQAAQYYSNINSISERNENKDIPTIVEVQERTVEIPSPIARRKIHLFDLGDDDE